MELSKSPNVESVGDEIEDDIEDFTPIEVRRPPCTEIQRGSAASNAQGVKPGSHEIVTIRKNSQSSLGTQIQAKEADVQVLAELTRALDKEEAVVAELRRMNDEIQENSKDGDSSVKE